MSNRILSEALLAVVSQRLLRKICPSCKASDVGCPECHFTGYASRLAVAEVLKFDRTLRNALTANLTQQDLMTLAKQQGFKSMHQQAKRYIDEGITTRLEADAKLGSLA